jgi:hypothetical protein
MAGREEQKRRKAAVARAGRIVGLPEMLKIIRYGREDDQLHLEAYANLLADKVEAAGDKFSADCIRKVAKGDDGATVIPLSRIRNYKEAPESS